MNLEELQSRFQRNLLAAECSEADWIRESTPGLHSQERLGIYHNAYRIRLIDVLLDTFEHTAIYLGDEWFQQLASSYVQTHLSTNTNIGFYGQDFPSFLTEQLPSDGEVSELALMDWKLRRAFDGADGDLMTQDDLQRLAAIESSNIRLQPVPTLSTIAQHFNTLDIWHAIDQDGEPPIVEQSQQPIEVVIWRKGHSPYFRSISKIESAALAQVCAGATLEAVGSSLTQDFPDVDVATEFGLMLHRWLDDELLSKG
ncbi:MAG: DNA-binding domain-containing protein [Candidatus Thiodiazotropha sp. (ex. Lucinisca nassula)]|nr:DNA-binding domain-containing protein [Candidatus Thiodiazotropha sp. (ex. Lucinisca nassula)]